MQHLRQFIRTTLKEMAMTGPKRIAIVRQMQDPDIQRFISMVDAAKSEKELRTVDKYVIIPDLRDRTEKIGDDTPLYWALYELEHAKEAELRREAKARERASIDARKAERQQKKDVVAAKIQRGMNNPVLKAALDKIGDGFHVQLKARYVEQETGTVNHYFTDGKFNLVDPDPDYKQWMRDPKGRAEKDHYDHVRSILRPFFKKDNPRSFEKSDDLTEDWQEIIDRNGQRYADDIVNSWKNKMSLKLGEVIDRKGGAEIELQGQLWSEYMRFTFADASCFDMKTQQVYARSKLGKDFVRFPTTFHNVRFADGIAMAKPSSDRMQAEFGISDATASVTK